MLSFAQYLRENAKPIMEAKPFGPLPGVKVMSLSQFAPAESGVQTEADEFGLGAKTRTPSDAEMQGYLKRIFDQEKTKADKVVMPYVHRKLLTKVDGKSFLLYPGSDVTLDTQTGTTFDVEALKKRLTARPNEILSQNQKMKKSGGKEVVYYNFGIPALVGLAVNEKTNDFVVVSTCPGAGQCQQYCYAMKGGYIQYPESSVKQSRMLNFLLNDPEGFFGQLKAEIAKLAATGEKRGQKIVIRWHDAGDFFSEEYRRLFFNVVEAFPSVLFYAYTKVASVANTPTPDNLVMNFSQGAKPAERMQVDISKQKHSSVVPKEMFTDLMLRKKTKDEETGKVVSSLEFKSPQALDTFKERLASKYNIPKESIITYMQMKQTPMGTPNQYNVIVVPGEGDVSASRRDVHGTYLLFH